MAGTKEIKRRIKSIKNTSKITKAMELVASSKMKRAVANALSSRLYAEYSWNLLTSLSEKLEEITHPFFIENKECDKNLLLLITSNRGLCGSYNAQAVKTAIKTIKENDYFDIIAVGKRGDSAMRHVGQNVIASFLDLPDNIKLNDIRPLSELITREYRDKRYKKIIVIYTDYISALSQKAHAKVVLPIRKEELKETIENLGENNEKIIEESKSQSYIFEGDTEKLIELLSEKLVRMQLYQMLLESNASEQSSRMVAMKNASEAAGEMIDDLTLVFNKARQAGITREITEISAGMSSVE